MIMRIYILIFIAFLFNGIVCWFLWGGNWVEGHSFIPNIKPMKEVDGFLDYTLLDSDMTLYQEDEVGKIEIHKYYKYESKYFKIVRLPENLLVDLPKNRVENHEGTNYYYNYNNLFLTIYMKIASIKFLNNNEEEIVKELSDKISTEIVAVRVSGKTAFFPRAELTENSGADELASFYKSKRTENDSCIYEAAEIYPKIYRIYKAGIDPSFSKELMKENNISLEKCNNTSPFTSPTFIVFDYKNQIYGTGSCIFHDKTWCGFDIINGKSEITYMLAISNLDKLININATVRPFIERSIVKQESELQ